MPGHSNRSIGPPRQPRKLADPRWPARAGALALALCCSACGGAAQESAPAPARSDAPAAPGHNSAPPLAQNSTSPPSLNGASPSNAGPTTPPAQNGAPAAQNPQPHTAAVSGPKVAFLGDSLAAGLHLPADQAFPAVVQRMLAARGKPFELLNAGVSGDTSAGGLRRVDWIMKQSPALVVVELGANDGLRGQPVAQVEQNLRGIIARIREHGAAVMLLGVRIPLSYGASYVDAFAALYPRIAQDMQVPYVPFFMEGVAGVPDMNLPDGIHPTAQGHEIIAKRLAEPLAEQLAKLR
jgi:acyl-CoA thioesterase I